MKISKKLYGTLFLLGLLVYGTSAHSMAFARITVAALKREGKQFFDRMPLGAVAAYKQEQKNIEHFKTQELFLQDAIPLSLRNYITNLFKKNGLHVTCICHSALSGNVPSMAITRIGSQVLFLMNDRSIEAFNGKNKDGYTREHMLAVVQHELAHALDRHVEKQFLLESIRFPLRIILSGAFLYQSIEAIHFWLNGSGCSEPLSTALMFFCMGKRLTSVYSRHCERQADQFVLKTNNDEQIKAYRDFFDIMRRQVGEEYLSHASTHPRLSERIEACERALINRAVVKKNKI